MLTLTKSTVIEILRWADHHPAVEVCGLVWARKPVSLGQTVHPLPNIHPDPAKYYRTSPKDVRRAFDVMDEQGGTPLAWYHSHPSGKSEPSETDMQGAFNTGMYYLIAYPAEVEMEPVQLVASPEPQRPRHETVWRLSAWECLSPGILIGAEYEVQG